MFTGIVEFLGTVEEMTAEGVGRRLEIAEPTIAAEAAVGDSIAVNGVCLTLVRRGDGRVWFDVGPETLARTNLGRLRGGDRVNLERALLPTSRISGHFVQGHVDGIAEIDARRQEEDWEWIDFRAHPDLVAQMVPKGSVAVDGISLTLVTVQTDRFRIMLIPHTLAVTTLGFRPVGDQVNIEIDILGKYVFHAVRAMHAKP